MPNTLRLRLCPAFVIALCICICHALQSAPSPQQFSNSICTSVHSPLCATNRSVDPCLQRVTLKAKSECLQNALEAYYGTDFTATCPNFAVEIADWNCAGCPWDRINVSALLNSRVQKLPLNASFFHIAAPSCSVANHVSKFKNWKAHELRVYSLPVFAGLILLLLTGFGNHFAGSNTISNPVWILGRQVPEWMYLSLLWLLLLALYVTLSFSQDYFLFCESSSTFLTQIQLKAIAHAGTLAYSFSRCLCLPSHRLISSPVTRSDGAENGAVLPLTSPSSSSTAFVGNESGISTPSSTEHETAPASSWYSRTGQCKLTIAVSIFFSFGCRLILLAIFIYDHRPLNSFPGCSVYYMKYSYALYVFARPLLEVLAVAIYATGPQRTRTRFIFRSSLLSIFLVGSIVLLNVTFPLDNGEYHLFPGLGLHDIGYGLLPLVHTIIVSLLGLLEPIRLGWPSNKTPKRTQ